ncbi:NAD(P)H-quinone oxidoreductase [Nocardioides sp. QY071]|uniref:NAD(P)H-quinone oxidoreductase n=1 Tax=Nocardioides sp. QY071 TaxID=3044187 RepID=UPI00249ADF91|nr:NAD(P)H-quinone oxidoreductase [Nocardioides sp. QY071]WGY02916.1 NAD(P)H-quinone oxidoreductase [Nocardioides sp. QY071]
MSATSLPDTMRVVVAAGAGGPEVLTTTQRALPRPDEGEALVRVIAAGVNRADLMQRAGSYPGTAAVADLGLEASGVVVAVGAGVADDLLGREVCALLPGGGYAEYVAVRAAHLAPVPAGVSAVDAAGLMEAAATVWSNLYMHHKPEPGSWLLVHGGASGIGTTAVQIASALGVRVATTVGSPDKAGFVEALGAELVIDHRRQDFAEVLLARSIRPAVVLDIVGAAYLERNLRVLDRGGRLVVIGHQSGATAPMDLEPLLKNNLTVTGSGLRMRPDHEKDQIIADLVRHVWPLYESRAIVPTTHAVLPLERASEAHVLLEQSRHRGKVLLLADLPPTTESPR